MEFLLTFMKGHLTAACQVVGVKMTIKFYLVHHHDWEGMISTRLTLDPQPHLFWETKTVLGRLEGACLLGARMLYMLTISDSLNAHH